MFCSICSNRINCEIQQDTDNAPTKTAMHNVMKPAMVYLSTKPAMRKILVTVSLEIPSTWGWYCRNYYPISPVYEFPNRSSVVRKSCSVCKNPIHTCYADLAYKCANPSCDNVCHLATMCSRFVNPRGTTRAHILST